MIGIVQEGVRFKERVKGPFSVAGKRAHEMRVGSSVRCDSKGDRDALRAALYRIGRTPRTQRRTEGNWTGYRVWRAT